MERKENRENREKRRLEECRQCVVGESQNSAVKEKVSSENQNQREPKRLTRVTQNEISLDVGGIVYWKTERLKKAEKNTSRVLVPFAGRGVLDS